MTTIRHVQKELDPLLVRAETLNKRISIIEEEERHKAKIANNSSCDIM